MLETAGKVKKNRRRITAHVLADVADVPLISPDLLLVQWIFNVDAAVSGLMTTQQRAASSCCNLHTYGEDGDSGDMGEAMLQMMVSQRLCYYREAGRGTGEGSTR